MKKMTLRASPVQLVTFPLSALLLTKPSSDDNNYYDDDADDLDDNCRTRPKSCEQNPFHRIHPACIKLVLLFLTIENNVGLLERDCMRS